MPMTIDLANVADQAFSVTLDNDRYTIRIFASAGCTACDMTRNDVDILDGLRITNGEFIIPFSQQSTSGNFILVTQAFALPDYTQFGTTQIFTYMSASEIAAAVGGTVP